MAADQPEQVLYAVTTSSFFPMLGARTVLGRDLTTADDQPGAAQVAVISHGLWQRHFGGDRLVAGRTLRLDGRSYEIVGVLPASFRFLSVQRETDVWLPLGSDPFTDRRYARGVRGAGVIGRLRPTATLASAQAELDAVAADLARRFPGDNRGRGIRALSLREQVVGHLRPAVAVLAGSVAMLLLIACANVANLLLARASARRRELAVRAALGAGRSRLVRQLLTEYALLGVVSGAIGLVVARWGLRVVAMLPSLWSRPGGLLVPYAINADDLVLNWVVVIVTAAISIGAALLFGLMPAFAASRVDATESLRGAGATADRGRRLRAALVAAEVALSLVLVTGAGLLLRTFSELRRVDLGFRSEGVLTFDVNLPPHRYRAAGVTRAFYDNLLAALRRRPGVSAAGASEYLPFSGADSATGLFVEGRPRPEPGQDVPAHYRSVTADYFRAMGIPLVAGRLAGPGETDETARVAVVNDAFRRRFFPNESPIGRRVAITLEALRFRPDGPPSLDVQSALREIVGVVADVRHAGVQADPFAEIYIPFAQRPVRTMTVVVRVDGDPAALAGDARAAVRSLDAEVPVANVKSLADIVAASLGQPRFNVALLSAFAAIALLLAVVGVYAVVSYTVGLRTREIGVRVALGGAPRDIVALVLRESARPVGIGLAVGFIGALGFGRVMSGLLFGVGPADPLAIAGASLVLVAASLAAALVPARRAAGLNPLAALRIE